jgi:hypothetical protein
LIAELTAQIINSCALTLRRKRNGYGAYAIGNATEWFLGSKLNVSCTGITLKGGKLYYGDSTREAVLQVNKELDHGLTNKELKSIPVKNTVVNSKLFGIMCTQDGTVDISGGTVFNTGNTTFIVTASASWAHEAYHFRRSACVRIVIATLPWDKSYLEISKASHDIAEEIPGPDNQRLGFFHDWSTTSLTKLAK